MQEPTERRRAAYWPVALGLALRLALWWMLPAAPRSGSDEESYFGAGLELLSTGHPDPFWPPVVPWLVALSAAALRTVSAPPIRLAWIALDGCCLLAVRALSVRLARAASSGDAGWLGTWVTAGYALYLPAVSYCQFATSETPALLQMLGLLLLLATREGRVPDSLPRIAGAGLLAGSLALTRPSLLTVLALVPIALYSGRRGRQAAVFLASGALLVGAFVLTRWHTTGEATISRNGAYNLYLGNREGALEELDLFHPTATKEQIAARQGLAEDVPRSEPERLQREAVRWIAAHPGTFARRALGRLARVFAPRTDVLALLGGERSVAVFAPRSLLLLGLANGQWAVVLFGGLLGLSAALQRAPRLARVVGAAIGGSLVLCLVALAKPRYSFVFEPLLLFGAAWLARGRGEVLASVGPRRRWLLAGAWAFLLWGWAAWGIFAVSSRPS